MIAMVLVAAIGGFGCFSTARYDDAHLQRVARINARYEAEHRREDEHYAALASALDKFRMQLIPTRPGSSASADGDADLDALLAFSHNQEALRYIAAQTKIIEQLQARAHDRLDADRQGEVHASDQQRASEIASGRAIRRARLQAAAYAFTAMDQGPISARQPCVGATGAQLLSRVGECRAGGRLSGRGGRGSSSHSSQPTAGGTTPARR